MTEIQATSAPEALTYEQLSNIVELPLLTPDLNDEQIAQGCALAKRYGMAAVVVRPSDLDSAERWVSSPLALAAAVDWPHGNSTTAVKQYAVRDALRRGAKEIMVTMNTSKLLSRQFQYLEMELLQISEACHEVHALLTVNLETPYLTEEHQVVACRIAKRAGIDFLSTSDPDKIGFLAEYTRNRVKLKLRDVATLDSALSAVAASCARIESPSAGKLLEEWKTRVVPAAPQSTT